MGWLLSPRRPWLLLSDSAPARHRNKLLHSLGEAKLEICEGEEVHTEFSFCLRCQENLSPKDGQLSRQKEDKICQLTRGEKHIPKRRNSMF